MDIEYTCTQCLMSYCLSQAACPYCDTVCQIYQNKRVISKLVCPACSFQNDLSNVICVACQAELYQNPQDKIKQKCEHCGEMVLKKLIIEHSTNCLLSMQMINEHKRQEEVAKQLQKYQQTYVQCTYCSLQVPKDLLADHHQVCISKPKPIIQKPSIKIPIKPFLPKKPIYEPYEPIVHPIINEPFEDIVISGEIKEGELFSEHQLARLTKLQKNAIMYMHEKSLKSHKGAQKQLQEKVKKLGFKSVDLQNLIFYIENYAPIIIHMHITKHMQFFVKDTHYRNQFETGKSSGSLSRQSRTQWEDRMFDKKYSKASDRERVKYGVINFTNDPKGVNCASGYGISYFMLKPHVRNRCTLTDMDSSSTSSLIGTFKYCFHILNKMSDKQLTSAFKAAKALEESSTVTTTYKQIQIHGPIQFAKDIERVYINKKQVQDKKYLDMVYLFCEKNKLDYEFI